MQPLDRVGTVEYVLRPLEIDYNVRPVTRKFNAWRHRREVRLIYPFLTADERKRADAWLVKFDEKMLAIVE